MKKVKALSQTRDDDEDIDWYGAYGDEYYDFCQDCHCYDDCEYFECAAPDDDTDWEMCEEIWDDWYYWDDYYWDDYYAYGDDYYSGTMGYYYSDYYYYLDE